MPISVWVCIGVGYLLSGLSQVFGMRGRGNAFTVAYWSNPLDWISTIILWPIVVPGWNAARQGRSELVTHDLVVGAIEALVRLAKISGVVLGCWLLAGLIVSWLPFRLATSAGFFLISMFTVLPLLKIPETIIGLLLAAPFSFLRRSEHEQPPAPTKLEHYAATLHNDALGTRASAGPRNSFVRAIADLTLAAACVSLSSMRQQPELKRVLARTDPAVVLFDVCAFYLATAIGELKEPAFEEDKEQLDHLADHVAWLLGHVLAESESVEDVRETRHEFWRQVMLYDDVLSTETGTPIPPGSSASRLYLHTNLLDHFACESLAAIQRHTPGQLRINQASFHTALLIATNPEMVEEYIDKFAELAMATPPVENPNKQFDDLDLTAPEFVFDLPRSEKSR